MVAQPGTGAPATPQERLNAVIKDAQDLMTKAGTSPLSAEESVKLEELLTEGHKIKAQIEQQQKANDLFNFGGKSAGMLPLANPAAGGQSAGMPITLAQPAGHSDVDIKLDMDRNGRVHKRSLKMMADYGEGYFEPASFDRTRQSDYRDAFRSYVRGGGYGTLKSEQMKALQEGADQQGGFLVPYDLLEKVIAREPTPTRVAGRCTNLQTSRDSLVIPKVNYSTDDLYTTGMRITWTGEIPSSSTVMRVTEPVFGQARISVYTAMMSIPVTNDMIEDSAFPIISWLSGKFAETVDLLRDNMVLNGTGIGQPAGILVNPNATDQPAVVNTGWSGATTAPNQADSLFGPYGSGIIKCAFSLPEQYDDNACWVMNKVSTAALIAQIQDAQARYIWGAGYQDSGLSIDIHDRPLMGYPVILSGFMPNAASGANSVIFGDLQGYYLVNRIGFSIQVLRELYAETNQILILGRVRFGGMVAEPWKLKVLQNHA